MPVPVHTAPAHWCMVTGAYYETLGVEPKQKLTSSTLGFAA